MLDQCAIVEILLRHLRVGENTNNHNEKEVIGVFSATLELYKLFRGELNKASNGWLDREDKKETKKEVDSGRARSVGSTTRHKKGVVNRA